MNTKAEPGHEPEITFARIEVKTGSAQLGFVQVTPLTEIHTGDKIVVQGAYYLQSHLQKSEGDGGHSH
jgi:membrane fusion protein, heavy metal efflux system